MRLKDLVEAFLIHLNNMTRNVIFRKINILEEQFEGPDILMPAILKRNRKRGGPNPAKHVHNALCFSSIWQPSIAGLAHLWKFQQGAFVQLLMCRAQH